MLLCDRRDFARSHPSSGIARPGGTLVGSAPPARRRPAGDRLIEDPARKSPCAVVHASRITFAGTGARSRPYIDEAILPTRDPCIEGDGAEDLRVSPVAASRGSSR